MKIISRRFGTVNVVGQFSLAVPMKGELIDIGLDAGSEVEITMGILNNERVVLIKKKPEVVHEEAKDD